MKIDKNFILKVLKTFKEIGEKEIPIAERSYLAKMPSVEQYMDLVGIGEAQDMISATLIETVDDDDHLDDKEPNETNGEGKSDETGTDSFDLPPELDNLSFKERYIENLLRPLGSSREEEHFEEFIIPDGIEEDVMEEEEAEDSDEMLAHLRGIPKSDVKRPDWLNKELFDDKFQKEHSRPSFDINELMNEFKDVAGDDFNKEEMEETAKALAEQGQIGDIGTLVPDVSDISKKPEIKDEIEPDIDEVGKIEDLLEAEEEPIPLGEGELDSVLEKEEKLLDEEDLEGIEAEDEIIPAASTIDEGIQQLEEQELPKELPLEEDDLLLETEEDVLPSVDEDLQSLLDEEELEDYDTKELIQEPIEPIEKDIEDTSKPVELGEEFWKDLDQTLEDDRMDELSVPQKGFDDIQGKEEIKDTNNLNDIDSFLDKPLMDDEEKIDEETEVESDLPSLDLDEPSVDKEDLEQLDDLVDETGEDLIDLDEDTDISQLPESKLDDLEDLVDVDTVVDLDKNGDIDLDDDKKVDKKVIDESDELGDLAALDTDIDLYEDVVDEKDVDTTTEIETEIKLTEEEEKPYPEIEIIDKKDDLKIEDIELDQEVMSPVELKDEKIELSAEEINIVLGYISTLPPSLSDACKSAITEDRLNSNDRITFINMLKSKAKSNELKNFLEDKLGIKIYLPKPKKDVVEKTYSKAVGGAMLIVSILLIVLGVITLLYFLVYRDHEKIESLYENGYNEIGKGNYKETEEYFIKAVQAESNNIPNIEWMAKYALAYEKNANEASSIDEKNTAIFLALNKYYGADPDTIEPEPINRGIIDINERNENAHLKINQLAREQAEFVTALNVGVGPLLKASPLNSKYREEKAKTYDLWGDYLIADEKEDAIDKYNTSYEEYNKLYAHDAGNYNVLASSINILLKLYEIEKRTNPKEAKKLKELILQNGLIIAQKLDTNKYIDPGITTKLADFYIANDEERIGQNILKKLSEQGEKLLAKADEAEEMNRKPFANSFYSLGNYYKNMGKYDEALTYYVEAIKSFGPYSINYINNINSKLGDVSYDRDDPKAFYSSITEIKKEMINNINNTFKQLIKTEDPNSSYAKLQSNIFNEIGEVYLNIAKRYFNIVQYEGDLKRRWVAHNHEYYDKKIGRKEKGIKSEHIKRKENLELARKSFLMAIAKNPDNYVAYKNLGDYDRMVSVDNNNIGDAVTYYEVAFQKFVNPKKKSYTALTQKDLDNMLLSIDTDIDKSNENFFYNLGYLYYQKKNYENYVKASNVWRVIHSSNNNKNRFNPQLNYSLANSYYKMKQTSMAIDQYRRVVDYYAPALERFYKVPDFDSVLQRNVLELVAKSTNNLAVTFYKKGLIDQAKQHFHKAKNLFDKVDKRYKYMGEKKEHNYKVPNSFLSNKNIFENNYNIVFTRPSHETRDTLNTDKIDKRRLPKLIDDIPVSINQI